MNDICSKSKNIIQDFIEKAEALRNRAEKLYIYGAGFYGQDVYRILENHDIKIDAFIVTEKQKENTIKGLPVLKADHETLHSNVGIILGLSDIYADEVLEHLKEFKIDEHTIINGGRIITVTGDRRNLRKNPVLEITPIIGCSVNCKYCPQEVLIRKYFENNKSRKREMTLEDFRVCLKNTPDNCDIMFAGMAEPFLNKDCVEMIKMACDARRRVSLYTTLAGANKERILQIIELPIEYVTFHVADKYGYAKVQLTEEYYEMAEMMISAKKDNDEPFVGFVNCQAEPDERIAEICRGKYEIMNSVQDRAGNLNDEALEKRSCDLKANEKIMCSFCGPELTNNVVLPDGTLLLCNMDYGMQHVLGNLYEDDYETIRSKGELLRVLDGMQGNPNVDLLCRKCLLARKRLIKD